MKKIILPRLTLIAVILIICSGCKKEVVGPIGPTGATGTSNIVATDSFYVGSGSWVNTTANFWSYTYTNTQITQTIVSKGAIQVSSWYPTGSYWVAWPFYSGSNYGSYHYYYLLNKLVLQVDNVTPPATSFKVVIIQ